MSNCYFCKLEISDLVKYNEHIILNAIGGKLTSDFIVCRNCARDIDDIDAALAKHLSPFSNLLNIRRDRGKPQTISAQSTNTNEDILLSPGGKPRFEKPKYKVTDKKFEIFANDKSQAKEVLMGLSRSFPELNETNIDNAISRGIGGKQRTGTLEISFDFRTHLLDKVMRSISKMATNFYVFKGGSSDEITDIISYIKGSIHNKFSWFYFDSNNLFPDFNNRILHSIVVSGRSDKGIIYSYIELFSALKCIVILYDQYTGNDFYYSYFFDVIDRNEINSINKLDLNLKKQDFIEIVNNKKFVIEEIRDSYEAVFSYAYTKQLKELSLSKFEEIFNHIKAEKPNMSQEEINQWVKKFFDKELGFE